MYVVTEGKLGHNNHINKIKEFVANHNASNMDVGEKKQTTIMNMSYHGTKYSGNIDRISPS